MAKVDVQSVTEINQPRERVARYAANPDNAPRWYVNIKAVEWQTPPPAAVGSKITFVAHFLGRRLEYTYEIVTLEPGRRLVMQSAEGPFPMETTYTWESLTASRTRMVLRNRGRPSGFSLVIVPFISLMMRRANQKDLALLKQILENEPEQWT